MAASKVAPEVAEQEFSRWAEALDLDVDPSGMDGEDRVSFTEQKRLILHAIEAGRLVINGEGFAVYSPRDLLEPITFHEPTGAVFMSKGRTLSDTERVLSMVQKLTGEPQARFESMLVRDYKVCTAIVTLLLAAR